MLDVLSKNGFELASAEDQHPVEALAADRADESLGKGVGTWRANGCADDPDPLGAEDLVEAGCENLASRSLTRNLTGRTRSANTIVRLRACWTTHAPTGLVVTPVTQTRRVSTR
jgi:hypothetical protein